MVTGSGSGVNKAVDPVQTARQAQILQTVRESWRDRDRGPTAAELAEACGWRSLSTPWAVVQRLIGRGLLYRPAPHDLRLTPAGAAALGMDPHSGPVTPHRVGLYPAQLAGLAAEAAEAGVEIETLVRQLVDRYLAERGRLGP